MSVRPEKTMRRRSEKKLELQLQSFLRELIGKYPMKISYISHKIMVINNDTLRQKQIATEFNTFSANVWRKLTDKIPEIHNNLKKPCKYAK